jgi:hypothetical protein
MYIIYPGKDTRRSKSAYGHTPMRECHRSQSFTLPRAMRRSCQAFGRILAPWKAINTPISSQYRNDPLKDITELDRVRFVMKAGRLTRDDFSAK